MNLELFHFLSKIPVTELMAKNVVSVDMDTSLDGVEKVMELSKISHLVVLDNGEMKGLISSGDVRRYQSPYSRSRYAFNDMQKTLNLKAHQIMTREIETIPVDTNLVDLLKAFSAVSFQIFPVMDGDRLKGVVTKSDLVRFFAKQVSSSDLEIDPGTEEDK